MSLLEGVRYNLRGLWFGLKSPVLLFWGVLRLVVVVVLTVVCAGLILTYHLELLTALWAKPESVWVVWLWYAVSWLLSLVLAAIGAVLAYLIAQILFSVLIMDFMSRLTERRITGRVEESHDRSGLELFVFLVKQEIPRAVLPVLISLLLFFFGWLTPLGPVIALASSALAGAFLAWDNTDLLPARRQVPFGERWRLFTGNFLFHLGFGLPFLIPGFNILALSFAPVGGTMSALRAQEDGRR